MKAYKLTGIRTMELFEVPTPEIKKDTDVLIKMTTIGVCGSDVHYYTTGKIGSQVVQYPFTVGHEGAGIVQRVGEQVTRVKQGDRIAIEPAMPCFRCDQCLSGRTHTCRNLKFLGCPGQAEGCLSEYIVMPESSCLPIPDSLTYDDAALSEPLSIGVYAVKQAQLNGNETVGVLGMGPIGNSVLLPALEKGIEKIYTTDKIDERLVYAQKAGAFYVGNPDKTDIVNEISEKEPLLLDVIFECCGKQEAVDQAIKLLKPGGKLMIVGIPQFSRWQFDADNMRRKEITIINVRRQNECVETALELIENKKISVAYMATHRFPFAKTKEAFDLVDNYADGVLKAMIDF